MGLATVLRDEMDRIEGLFDQLRAAGRPYEDIRLVDDAINKLMDVEWDVPSTCPAEHKDKLERLESFVQGDGLAPGVDRGRLLHLIRQLIEGIDKIDGQWINTMRLVYTQCLSADHEPAVQHARAVLTGATALRLAD